MDGSGGNSALGQAMLLGLDIEAVRRQIVELNRTARALSREQHRWRMGGEGELGVVRALAGMDDAGWHVLADRRWPGTSRANIDILVVGPGGVFVIDVKTWQDARLVDGQLWRGDAGADDEVDRLLRQSGAVQALLAEEGLPPTEVVPLLVLAGRRNTRGTVGRVLVCGELDLAVDLARRGLRLPPTVVERLVEALDRGCPPMPTPAPPPGAAPPGTAQPTPAVSAEPDLVLFTRARLWDELLEAAAREPVETWMTWLHPTQARQISRQWSGPARIRGAAGTGKTVLALHRARYLAGPGRPGAVHLVRPDPAAGVRIAVRPAGPRADRPGAPSPPSTSWPSACSGRRRAPRRWSAPAAVTTCFNRAWAALRHDSALVALDMSVGYWHDEITQVIKGRGLSTFAEYAELARVGRQTPLQPAHRAAVWRLYEEYERRRVGAGLLDWTDVLREARDLVRRGVDAGRYQAVIVDEVQDLNIVGLQLLQGLLGREADGLLLVGDGQQSIYPGGFTLTEAGVSVVGRSTVLDRNYRNAGDVLRYAQSVVGDDPFDDLDSERAAGRRAVDVVRAGGRVVQAPPCRPEDQVMVLAEHIRGLRDSGVRLGDLAVLVPTNSLVERWLRALTDEQLPAIRLADYDGTRAEMVKVGTFHRAKGLEFGHVLVPDRNHWPPPRRPAESADDYRRAGRAAAAPAVRCAHPGPRRALARRHDLTDQPRESSSATSRLPAVLRNDASSSSCTSAHLASAARSGGSSKPIHPYGPR